MKCEFVSNNLWPRPCQREAVVQHINGRHYCAHHLEVMNGPGEPLETDTGSGERSPYRTPAKDPGSD